MGLLAALSGQSKTPQDHGENRQTHARGENTGSPMPFSLDPTVDRILHEALCIPPTLSEPVGLCQPHCAPFASSPFLFQELLQEFESEMQKREHEFRLRADSMSSVVLAHELKVAGPSDCDCVLGISGKALAS